MQHYDRWSQYDMGLFKINEAMQHTPTWKLVTHEEEISLESKVFPFSVRLNTTESETEFDSSKIS